MRLPVHHLSSLRLLSSTLLLSTLSPLAVRVAAVPADPNSPIPALWPEPTSLSYGNTVLWLDPGVEVVYVRNEKRGPGDGEGEDDGDGNGEVSDGDQDHQDHHGHGEEERDGEGGCICHGVCGCGCGCNSGDGGIENGNGDGDVDVDVESVNAPVVSESVAGPGSESGSVDGSVGSSTVTVTVTASTGPADMATSVPTTAPESPSGSAASSITAPVSVDVVSSSLLAPESTPAAGSEEEMAKEREKEKEREKFDTHIGRNRHGYGVRRIRGRQRPGAVPLSVPVAVKKRSLGKDDVDKKSAIITEQRDRDRRVRRGGDLDRGHRHGRPQSGNKQADDKGARPAAAVSTEQVPIKGRRVRRGGDSDRGPRHGRLQNRNKETDQGASPAAVTTMDQVQEKLAGYQFNFRDSVKEAIRDKFHRFVSWIRNLFEKTPSWRKGLRPMVVSQPADQTPLRAMESDLKGVDKKGVWSWIWSRRTVNPTSSSEEENELPTVDQIIESAIARAKAQMLNTKFVPWKFYPRHTIFEPDVTAKSHSNTIRKITILEDGKAYDSIRDYIDGDESYRIAISKTGEIEILSFSRVGTLRALQTLPQLFYAHTSGPVYMPFAPVYLADGPKWKHRGLNLDIARNWFSTEDVKRTIDAMASVKLNRLHVHATDSQSWPIEIPSIPQLSARGSYCAGCVWSAKDLRDVQLYGLERGISVFLEIDIPGHTASIGHAFLDLVVAFEHGRWEKYSQEPPSGQLSLNNTAVDDFLDRLLDDVVPRVAPFTKYFHTGGDELNTNTYLLDPNVESNDPAVLTPLVQGMVRKLHSKIRQAGLTPIVWEELALDWNLTFSDTSEQPIIQSWRDTLAVKDLLKRGNRVIFGAADAWYLDCGVGGFFNPRENINVSATSPISPSTININLKVHGNETENDDTIKATVIDNRAQDPFLDWCSPVKNWRHMYVHNPLNGINENLTANVEGGEAHMWTEMVDGVSLDGMVWPRTAAVAEVLWGGPKMVSKGGKSGVWDEGVKLRDATRRLGEWRERAVLDMGVRASVVSMVWCLMGGNCDI